jgi:hypothetical protein
MPGFEVPCKSFFEGFTSEAIAGFVPVPGFVLVLPALVGLPPASVPVTFPPSAT